MNQKFQNALAGKVQTTPPIWFMRQAGRYHSHYQALRKQHSFEDLCKKADLAAEVARGPVAEFDFDVAILFSDILFPLEGLGMGLAYTDHGPKLGFQLSPDTFGRLGNANEAISFLKFQGEALQKTRKVLPADKSLIGFVGGLWTLYVYAVEGSHAGGLIQSKSRPSFFHQFMEKLFPVISANIQNQIQSGAEVVMIFDTAAGEVSADFFRCEIQDYLIRLAKQFPHKLGYYSKGTQKDFFSEEFMSAPWAGMGVDHRWSLKTAFAMKRPQGFLQGNFDQALLHQDEATFHKTLDHYLKTVSQIPVDQRAGWVCGLGHGVLPKTPEQNVKYFVQRVREHFA
jgi:uroporphyrinogen decarboxylase